LAAIQFSIMPDYATRLNIKTAWLGLLPHMLFQNAAIHDDHQSCLQGPGGRIFINHAFLEPHGPRSKTNRFINMLSSFFGAAKYVHQIELLWRVGQAGVSPLAQNFGLIRVDRDDAVTALLHVPRDAETGSNRVGRQTDDRDSFTLVKDSFNNLRVVDFHLSLRIPLHP
jgi:hypothetical protein